MQSVGTRAVNAPVPLDPLPFPKQSLSSHLALRCTACGGDLAVLPNRALLANCVPLICRQCHAVTMQEKGIWRALSEDRRSYFARFIVDYETVRRLEGRGSDDPQFYLSLPNSDRTGRNSWQWAIRARTYSYLRHKILPLISIKTSPLNILDLGAGNGWMSYRLSRLGHHPVAVDLLTNEFDGLGAGVHYQRVLPVMFPRFQAEFENLPFASRQFDCAIFNASFHYSEDYDRALAEAIRCLRCGGILVIADSPSYSREESGRQMLAERQESFQRTFGFRSNSLASREFLTQEILRRLEVRHDIQWATHRPWHGIRWACRPLVAHLKGRREPSQFHIYTARVSR